MPSPSPSPGMHWMKTTSPVQINQHSEADGHKSKGPHLGFGKIYDNNCFFVLFGNVSAGALETDTELQIRSTEID